MAELARVRELEFGERSKTLRLADVRAKTEPREPGRAPLWSHFRSGQMLELSGHAPGKLSTVARLIARAQAEGEPVAWVGARDTPAFYPPDFVLSGIDLATLVVVRIPLAKQAAEHKAEKDELFSLLRASEVLLRSGAFGLVVIDFANFTLPRGELSWQARLSGLVRKHDARLVLLTGSAEEAPSLGPLIGLRVEPALESARQAGRVVITPRVLKSKLGEETVVSPDLRSLPAGAHWG